MLEKYLDEINKCTRCGFCRVWGWKDVDSVCPVYKYTDGWETQYPRGRVKLAKLLTEKKIKISEKMVDHLLMCTLCGHCKISCPINIPLDKIFHAIRKEIVENDLSDPAHREMANNVIKDSHPFGNRRRHSYAEKNMSGKIKVLYYPGCNANYNAPKIIRATKSVFAKLQINYQVLDEDACCGYPLYESGHISDMKMAAEETLSKIEKYEADIIVTACPGCLNALKHLYPNELSLNHNYDIKDISEFLIPLVNGKLSSHNKTVTWHDPCVLGRHLGIYEEPRNLLKVIPDINFVEMKLHHEKSRCCGAPLAEIPRMNELSIQVASERAKEVEEVKAQEVVTSCPACYSNLKRAVGFNQLDVKVKFLTELINEVLSDE
ncbi:MAG: hypothetical protein APF76_06365 [Desulfitibacter sp. BRH_c19]|nr:MAG: hypothetical protein APF76_06365 [Desulfitibacter sp. BRH_c19]